MSGLEKALFNLKVAQRCPASPWNPRLTTSQFTTKQLNRQAAKAGKDETAEKAKLEKVCFYGALCIVFAD
jgi:charged multivesicular body protein 1